MRFNRELKHQVSNLEQEVRELRRLFQYYPPRDAWMGSFGIMPNTLSATAIMTKFDELKGQIGEIHQHLGVERKYTPPATKLEKKAK